MPSAVPLHSTDPEQALGVARVETEKAQRALLSRRAKANCSPGRCATG